MINDKIPVDLHFILERKLVLKYLSGAWKSVVLEQTKLQSRLLTTKSKEARVMVIIFYKERSAKRIRVKICVSQPQLEEIKILQVLTLKSMNEWYLINIAMHQRCLLWCNNSLCRNELGEPILVARPGGFEKLVPMISGLIRLECRIYPDKVYGSKYYSTPPNEAQQGQRALQKWVRKTKRDQNFIYFRLIEI